MNKYLFFVVLQLSRIQALFFDAVVPLSGLINGINKGTEVTVDDVKGAVKAALTSMRNAFSSIPHCGEWMYWRSIIRT